MSQPSVLFVCTANICRSPMAMGLLRLMVSGEAPAWRIESAGVWAESGLPAASHTQTVLQRRGIQILDHLSQVVTRKLLEEFNLILVMENNHKEAIFATYPDLHENLFLLSEMVGGNYDIVDPIGGYLQDYEDTAKEMEKILNNGFSKITSLAEKSR